jgi:hypothetical protein
MPRRAAAAPVPALIENDDTIAETRRTKEAEALASAENHPLVAAALAAFPGATISAVRPLIEATPDDVLAAVPEDDDDLDEDLLDDGDPFQEDM